MDKVSIGTPAFVAIITGLFGLITALIVRIFNKKTEAATIEKDSAVAEQTRIITGKLRLELDGQLIEQYQKQISQLLKDKEVDQKAKQDLSEINKSLIESNNLLRKDVRDLKTEIQELRLDLVKSNLLPSPLPKTG